jgi:cellulose 1,4-beta-cellobiosidase
MDCSGSAQCDANSDSGVVMDANWRWAHDSSSQNCYTGDSWASICSDPDVCAQKCCLEGVDYAGDSGVKEVSGGINLGFVTQTAYGKSVGSRLYVTEGDQYLQFNMLDKEIAFDVDVSALECGMNGAVYFVEMAADGEVGGNNKGGVFRGTGYCDGQCARDIKFSDGHANSKGWSPNTKDPYHNTGSGSEGYCCAEMDLWEANKISTAFTAHPMTGSGKITCHGDAECGNQQDQRYIAPSDRDGCDINAYRNGDHTFYGPGSDFAVDTTKPITVVTQFYTTNGDLSEIKQFYVQNGKAIAHRSPSWSGANSITDEFCKEQKTHFDDQDEFTAKGGLKQMGESFKRGMTLVLSLWDDPMSGMEWLDSIDDKGAARGSCEKGSGDPATLREQYASASVSYTNVKWGKIGTTQSVYPPDTPTPVPTPSPKPPPPTPSPPSGDCPGGSLSACIAICPRDPAAVYQVCVQTCVERCPGAALLV